MGPETRRPQFERRLGELAECNINSFDEYKFWESWAADETLIIRKIYESK